MQASIETHGSPSSGSAPKERFRSGEYAQPALPFFLEALRFIEAQKGVASLSLRGTEGRSLGGLFICDGRVGLGRMGDGSRSLARYLAQRNPEVAARVRGELRRLRAEGRPLIEGIESLPADDAAIIRAAIADQVAEGLAEIEQHAEDPCITLELVRSERARKPPLCAFPMAAEVYWRTVGLLYPAQEDAAQRCYGALEEAAPAALCVRAAEPGWPAYPVRSRGLEHLSVGEILQLGYHVETLANSVAMVTAGRAPMSALLRGAAGAALLVATPNQIAMIEGLEGEVWARAVACAHRLSEEA